MFSRPGHDPPGPSNNEPPRSNSFPKIRLVIHNNSAPKPAAPRTPFVLPSDRNRPRRVTLRLPGALPTIKFKTSYVPSPSGVVPAFSGHVQPVEFSEDESGSSGASDDDMDLNTDSTFPRFGNGGGFPRVDVFPTIDPSGGVSARSMFNPNAANVNSNSTGGKQRLLPFSPPRTLNSDSVDLGSDDMESVSSGVTGTRDGYPMTEDGDTRSNVDGMDQQGQNQQTSCTGPPGFGNKRKGKRGGKFTKARKPMPEGYVRKQKVMPKRAISNVLLQIVARLKKQDAYGFFWHPVDPAAVPDYAKIITSPMDFETMLKKIEAKEYNDIREFRSDFQLIVDNCRTFNPPTTPYHKAANKLDAFGNSLIERESNAVHTLKDSLELFAAEEAASRIPRVTTPVVVEQAPAPVAPPINYSELDASDARRVVVDDARNNIDRYVPRKKYEKRPKVRRFFGFDSLDTDGSLLVESDERAWERIPPASRFDRFLDKKHMAISTDPLNLDLLPKNSMGYLFMNSAREIGTRLPETEFTGSTFGGPVNEVYIESMLAFAEGAGPKVAQYARRKAANLTRGGSELVRAVVNAAMEGTTETELKLPKIFNSSIPAIKEELAVGVRKAERGELLRLMADKAGLEHLNEAMREHPPDMNAARPGLAEVRQMAAENLKAMKLLAELKPQNFELPPDEAEKLAQIPPILHAQITQRLGAAAIAFGLTQPPLLDED